MKQFSCPIHAGTVSQLTIASGLRPPFKQIVAMHICLDVDDTITYAPSFFRAICEKFAEAKITIVTFRTNKDETENYLDSVSIRYDQVIVSTDPENGKHESESLHEWKANLVNQLQPDMFFEDMPEVVALISPSIMVFMPCDEVIREWIANKLAS